MNEPAATVRAQDIGDVAIKFVGLYLLVIGVMSTSGLLLLASSPTGSETKVLGAAMSGFTFLTLGVCLTRWSASLSKKLFGSVAAVGLPLPIATELQIVAFRVMGVYALISGLPPLVQGVVESTNTDLRFGALSMAGFFGTQVALGVMLLLYRSAWVLSLWKKLRRRPAGAMVSTR